MTHDADRTLHSLFEERVRHTPNAAAVQFQDEVLSYSEVNRRANRLAHHLRDVDGVCPDDRVVILVEHPVRRLVAVLATLKAGGAYVPLDPHDPPRATRRIIEDVDPRALVIESSTAASAVYFDGGLVVIDVMEASLQTSDIDPEPRAVGANLAYVMYTSGTTGRPKGVAVEHRAILNTVTWRNAFYDFDTDDVTLAIPQPSFDSSVADTFCALTAGARLVLPVRDLVTDRRYLSRMVEDLGVTHFMVTPALYARVLSGFDARSATSLRVITLAGERFTSKLTHEHFRRLPGVQLLNEYGPAENAVCSTVAQLSANDTSVLIGRPIDNVEVFVLAEDGTRVPPGGRGELFLGGVGLARCYLNDPELTAENFFVLPRPAGEGERVYRTGDIVRVWADGTLEFIERRDSQVQISVLRVELGFVAEVLASDAAVDHVYLSYRDTERDVPKLIAFVQGPALADLERLHALGRDSLPRYMVPSVIVPVDALPLTGNGKVDEPALIAQYLAFVSETSSGASASVDPTEAALLQIWQRVLGSLRVGLDDDFFDLGGDSLSVVDLVAAVEDVLGFELSNSAVYTDRTVRALARSVNGEPQDGAGAT